MFWIRTGADGHSAFAIQILSPHDSSGTLADETAILNADAGRVSSEVLPDGSTQVAVALPAIPILET